VLPRKSASQQQRGHWGPTSLAAQVTLWQPQSLSAFARSLSPRGDGDAAAAAAAAAAVAFRLVALACDMAAGVAHLHAHGLVHRDIALRNFLLSAEGRAMICDFGLARRVQPEADSYYRVSNLARPLALSHPSARPRAHAQSLAFACSPRGRLSCPSAGWRPRRS
jgi:hypothetical protein